MFTPVDSKAGKISVAYATALARKNTKLLQDIPEIPLWAAKTSRTR
jgi:hypothetical protein